MELEYVNSANFATQMTAYIYLVGLPDLGRCQDMFMNLEQTVVYDVETEGNLLSASRRSVSDTPANWQWHEGPVPAGTAVVVDIDGVLSNADERQHYLDSPNRDWKSFFGACGQDSVIEETRRILSLMADNVVVVLLTGRPAEIQPQTVDWLGRKDVRWDLLIMRDRGTYNESLTFKRQSVRQLKVMGFDVQLGFEDDEQNLKMFKEEGVPCMYIHSGYYDARDAELKKATTASH